MTENVKKCPNCGHVFNNDEEFCPNCDLFTTQEAFVKRSGAQDSDTVQDEPDKFFFEPVPKNPENKPEPSLQEEEKPADPAVSKTDNAETADSAQLNEADDNQETNAGAGTKQPESEPVSAKQTPPPANQQHGKNNGPAKRLPTKYLVAAAAIILIAASIFGINSYQKKVAAEELEKKVELATNAMDRLYTDADHVFLKEGIAEEDVAAAEKAVNKVKGEKPFAELNERLTAITAQFELLNGVNHLFKTPAIDGRKLSDESYVVDDSELTLDKIAHPENEFDELINAALTEAANQKKALSEAKSSLEKIFKDEKVVASATRDQYKDSKKLIDAVKDPDVKKAFSESLAQVDKSLNEKEKKLAAEKEAEEARQAELAREQELQAANNNNSSYQPTDPSYRWGNRQDAYINDYDPAWVWGDGIQQDVIGECIRRGYIVDGGYSLVKKYVENGEGYYDLYATTNSKLFPKSRPEEFPIYVVTINCKTGWFKGNGPN
ncbi:cell division site-positioning protein MapZ family protein [Vagococcus acidifermentans]|uniref:Uncharacterized protein n=1 Tax=Vagococcus acidifermentans TaxID=564710 RepID=A0A430ARG9_9ENTE|nr:cell division site-positioning protein MapZ family protein [Vagococcus acidifermentans]RSU10653.1 hypothetical protein CBF27_10065 [Vagococcus acidifermentans]